MRVFLNALIGGAMGFLLAHLGADLTKPELYIGIGLLIASQVVNTSIA